MKYYTDCEKIKTPTSCWWECAVFVKLLWKIFWKFLKRLNTELSYDPAIPLLSIYTKQQKHVYMKRVHE